ncbi:protein SWEETIE-like isoform X1 [Primulina eburnea]|uniref:protein SWEETIE-like isoform X1 n=2 Tax=Primulina eburnea TaxID=1245227 RepID=UPI003C6CBA75
MLADSDIQIQAVGLQVLKVILQKGIGAASNTFIIIFVGELVGDLLIIIRNALEKHVKREAVAIAGESLKILTLLHTLSKGCDHQKGVINLLLEALLTVFSVSHGSLSQEVHDLRSISIKIVSQLAQIPSSAVSVKEILLAMPATRRQQLQDIIRASVTQDQIAKPAESSGPPLVIKLPSPTEQNETSSSLRSAPPKDSPKESDSNSNAEEDDDWDTFQSFPASRNGTVPTEERATSCSDSSNGDSTSPSCGNKEILIAEDQDLNEGANVCSVADNSSQMEEHHVTEDGHSGDNESYYLYQLSDKIKPSNSDSLDLCNNIRSDQAPDEFERTVTAPSNENKRLLSDVIGIETKEIYSDPSDRHNAGTSHCNKQGLSEPQSTEIAVANDDLSREDRHEDGMDINGRENSVEYGKERL